MGSWKSTLLGALLLIGGVAAAQDPTSLAPRLGPPMPARLATAASVPPATVPGGHALSKTDLDAWLDGYMPYALRSADIPGAVVTVVKGGQILTARGFGYADAGKRTLVDPDRTLFRPGSVSKLVTWTAAMQLVEQGKLDLDADVNTYLDFKIPPRAGKPVTLRELMTHTAGFEEAANHLITHDPHEAMPLERYLKAWTPRLIFAPGSTPAYSNWATTLTGYIVQRVSGESFDSYVERHVFAPLGMKNSSFRQPLPAALAAHMATGYGKPGTPDAFEFINPAPAGALSSTGVDMARFMLAHLNRGAGLMRPQTADMMHNSPLAQVDPMSLLPPLNRMELGFFETNINGREVIGHLGDTNAFHTSLHLFMNEGLGLYVSFNSPGRNGAVQALRTSVFDDFADRYFPDIGPPDGRVDAHTAAEHARMMTGNWIASRRADSSFLTAVYWLAGQAAVTTGAKGELVIPSVVNAGGRPRQWVEIAPFVWRDANGHDRLAAKVTDGRVVRWSYDFASPFEMFDRVPVSRSATWLLPALYASLAILLLTFLHWPAAALVRRSFKAAHPLAGAALRAHRATRLMAGLVLALLIGWIAAITVIMSGGGVGPAWLWLLQIAGAILFFGMVLISGWNLWRAFADRRGWLRKLGAVLTFLAALLVLYVAVAFNLMAMTVNY